MAYLTGFEVCLKGSPRRLDDWTGTTRFAGAFFFFFLFFFAGIVLGLPSASQCTPYSHSSIYFWSLAIQSCLFSAWERDWVDTTTNSPLLFTRFGKVAFSAALSNGASQLASCTTKRQSTFVFTLLTFCPPGPEERAKLNCSAEGFTVDPNVRQNPHAEVSSCPARVLIRNIVKIRFRALGPLGTLADYW